MKAKPKRRGEVQQEARYPAGDLAVDLVAAHAPYEAIRGGNLCYVMPTKKSKKGDIAAIRVAESNDASRARVDEGGVPR